MKLTQENIKKCQKKKDFLDLSSKQLSNIIISKELFDLSIIIELNLSQNYIKDISNINQQLVNIKKLDISLNQITNLDSIISLNSLEDLNISTNSISCMLGIQNLSKLKYLNMEMNYIQTIDLSKNQLLEIVKLSGNQISHLENLPRSIKHLEISQNLLEDLGELSFPPIYENLEVLSCDFNQIPVEYLEHLCLTLVNLPKLKDLDLTGNEITLHEYYKYKLVAFSHIELLDNLNIKPEVRSQLEKLKQGQEFTDIIEKTKNEYMMSIEQEQNIKNEIRSLLQQKEKDIDMIFDQYKEEMEKDLSKFIDFANYFQTKMDSQIDSNKLLKWRNKVEQVQLKRKQLQELAQKSISQKKLLIEHMINNPIINEKIPLYNGSQNKELQIFDEDDINQFIKN